MYKIIDLGCEVPQTGEPRCQLLHEGLVKTASSEIQEFWDTLNDREHYAYLWVIGVSAKEFYGCNNNGDAFTEEDLKKTHHNFVDTANVFLQHVNRDPAKGIGKPIFSWYNDAMHRVELILRIDKSKPDAITTVNKIKNGEQLFVSMGCTVAYDVCSICGNKAPSRKEYCEHLRYNLKKILPDGRQVYALNPNPRFFDISIVAKPADPTAYALDKAASYGYVNTGESAMTSAELGEREMDINQKVAALKKLSDIIKHVEGKVVDDKGVLPDDDWKRIDAAKMVSSEGFENMDYPEMPYETLSDMGVSPAAFIHCMHDLNAPITLGDAAWMSGSGILGRCPSHRQFGSIFSMLPAALELLTQRPNLMDNFVNNICGMYNGDLDQPVHKTIIIRVIKPVAQARIRIITNMAPRGALEKIGSVFGSDLEERSHYGRNFRERVYNRIDPRSENFKQITMRDSNGNEAVTTPYNLRQDVGITRPLGSITSAALASGAIAGAIVEPSLTGKILAAATLGLPAAAIYGLTHLDTRVKIETSERAEIPVDQGLGAWKTQKTAAMVRPRLGTIAGLALPAALATDYLYNRWKYEPYDDPEQHMGNVGRFMNRAGQFVYDHPVAVGLSSGLVGSQLSRGLGALGRKIFTRGK